ncbi:MAG: HD domain-containing phosphohydrolase [Burkholderiaceae bacterium]
MMDPGYDFIVPDKLRIGLYIELQLGWMSHPFPKGSFKISNLRQIETLRTLGLDRIRYIPARSDPAPADDPVSDPGQQHVGEPQALGSGNLVVEAAPALETPQDEAQRQQREHAQLIQSQNDSLARCDKQFDAAIRQYRQVLERIAHTPTDAAALCGQLVDSLVGDMLGQSESSIRLLSETSGDRAWMHPVNVTVLSLLMGKALGLAAQELQGLGVAAFLHDVGKIRLPDRVRLADVNFAPAEYRVYQSHVAHGVAIAMQMGLSSDVQRTVGEHHEMMDGSGFPRQTPGTDISLCGKVLALVNRYENMCNPPRASAAVTPHEALSMIFSQMKDRFDIAVLAAFIRMMGVYPPGSVVQLSDGRFALVVSVNSARPLKPRVLVHEPSVPKEEALILNLEQAPASGIRRSLRPDTLPRAAIDYLSPRLRICYFFEQACDPARSETAQ